MLILSRRTGEAIVIDDKIKLTVLSIKGRQVRLGIDAPNDVTVHREEIYQRIKAGEDTGFSGSPAPEQTDTTNTPTGLKSVEKLVTEVSANDEKIEVNTD